MDSFVSYKSPYKIKKYNIILDLDNTLICSLDMKHEINKIPQDIREKFHSINMDNYYQVFERPYLQDFLTYLFDNFNVSIFTAADKDYALFVIDNIILRNKSRKLDYIMFNFHVQLSEIYFSSIKDLSLLWNIFRLPKYNRDNTIIIDDLPEVYNANPNNAIQIKKFDILANPEDAVHDVELLKLRSILEWRTYHGNKIIN